MFLIGHGTKKEHRRLERAGYKLLRSSGDQGLSSVPSDGLTLLAIRLDTNVTDLLTPPLCPYCGHFMGDPEECYEDGAHVLHYQCENCGAEEEHARYPPRLGWSKLSAEAG